MFRSTVSKISNKNGQSPWHWMTLAVSLIQEFPLLTSAEKCVKHDLAYFPYSDAAAKSCEDVYYKHPEYRNNPGYY